MKINEPKAVTWRTFERLVKDFEGRFDHLADNELSKYIVYREFEYWASEWCLDYSDIDRLLEAGMSVYYNNDSASLIGIGMAIFTILMEYAEDNPEAEYHPLVAWDEDRVYTEIFCTWLNGERY